MVEAAGVEPASGNIPLKSLHACPLIEISLGLTPKGRNSIELSCKKFRSRNARAHFSHYPAYGALNSPQE